MSASMYDKAIQIMGSNLPGEAVKHLEVSASAFFFFHYQTRAIGTLEFTHTHTSREGWSDAMAAKWLFLGATARQFPICH